MLNPDMKADELRLHMGELNQGEARVARAAIRWANAEAERRVAELEADIQLMSAPHESVGHIILEYRNRVAELEAKVRAGDNLLTVANEIRQEAVDRVAEIGARLAAVKRWADLIVQENARFIEKHPPRDADHLNRLIYLCDGPEQRDAFAALSDADALAVVEAVVTVARGKITINGNTETWSELRTKISLEANVGDAVTVVVLRKE